ncbi:SDR family oxidoreductase [Gammaproteobacteria bacterium]|nr:SDR family oxidoreductase [Gammaproteobacteria bacterium]
MKKILITGGAGFLGSHLCKKLLDSNYHITCLDNLLTGSLSNIKSFNGNQNFNFINHDITNEFKGEFDEIYNLACPASPIHYQTDPIKTMKTSVLGSINLLELAKKHQSKIFQASTSEIYGDPEMHPQQESYWGHVNPIGPRSCYDEGKRCAETLFFDYYRQHNLQIKLVRIFNTYGPKMNPHDGRVVSNFIVQAIQGEDISIYGDGSQTRSFCFVDDMIEGFIAMMESDKGISGPINLGNPIEFTILELAEKIIGLIGGKSKIIFNDLPIDDPKKRKPDISKAKIDLGWTPKISIDEGLDLTIDYFKNLLNS